MSQKQKVFTCLKFLFVCFLQMGLTLMLAFKVLSLSEGNIWLFHPDPTVKTAGST